MTPVKQGLEGLRGPTRALFTDLDSTMTTAGHLRSDTVASSYRLRDAGVEIVLVTGRPAGWGHALANIFPFTAVITENGGVSFIAEGNGYKKIYGVPEANLSELRSRMRAAAHKALQMVPDARMSSDSHYREVDLAIDWNEEVKIPRSQADRIVALLQTQGFAASRSSVHVNYGPKGVDKSTACLAVLKRVFAADASDLDDFVYLGDSLNDAPAFALFPKSVGVANVGDAWALLPSKPAYITHGSEGAGFEELVARLLELSA
ncbi:MAG: HAD family phosphatase [Kofleriaceae bacterium]|nr:HAD family phosphatase [Kofleriaceae bacterium]